MEESLQQIGPWLKTSNTLCLRPARHINLSGPESLMDCQPGDRGKPNCSVTQKIQQNMLQYGLRKTKVSVMPRLTQT